MKYQGKDGLVWFTGVVEDRNDPLFLNRVRVRIYGSHTHDKQLIATPDLPWSEVLMPTTSPSLSGLGKTTHGLVEGSTVMGFYRDGKDQQDTVIIGSFIGIPQTYYRIDETIDDKGIRNFQDIPRTTTEGFNDPRLDSEASYEGTPDGKTPQHINRNYGLTLALDKSPRSMGGSTAESYPRESYIGSSDVNKLALGDPTFYPAIAEAKGEPTRSNYVKPIYPFNHVHETESGHVVELDDTPDAERLHAYHRTGTRVEIDKDGNYVEKIVKDKYTVILGDDTVKIQGAVDIKVGESLAADAIKAAGGSTTVATTATEDIVDEDGNLTDEVVSTLKDEGATDTEITEIKEAVGGFTTLESGTGDTEIPLGGGPQEDKTFVETIREATEEALDVYDDVTNNADFQTVVNVVKGVGEGGTGYLAVIDEIEKEVGTELNADAKDVLTDVLSGANTKDVVIAKGIEIAVNKLTEVIKESTVVKQMRAKLDEVMGEAVASLEGMEAVINEKVSAAVTSALGEKLGEEVGAQVAAAVSTQVVNAVSSLATSAVLGAVGVGGAAVKIEVGGSVQIITKGNTSIHSFGSTNITSLKATTITTVKDTTITSGKNTTITSMTGAITATALTGDIIATAGKSITATAGTTMTATAGTLISANAPVIQANAPGGVIQLTAGGGAITLNAENIVSIGNWAHVGPMAITGATLMTGDTTITGFTKVAGLVTVGGTLVVAGAVTASLSLASPLITGAVHTHTHIASSFGAPTTTGVGT